MPAAVNLTVMQLEFANAFEDQAKMRELSEAALVRCGLHLVEGLHGRRYWPGVETVEHTGHKVWKVYVQQEQERYRAVKESDDADEM